MRLPRRKPVAPLRAVNTTPPTEGRPRSDPPTDNATVRGPRAPRGRERSTKPCSIRTDRCDTTPRGRHSESARGCASHAGLRRSRKQACPRRIPLRASGDRASPPELGAGRPTIQRWSRSRRPRQPASGLADEPRKWRPTHRLAAEQRYAIRPTPPGRTRDLQLERRKRQLRARRRSGRDRKRGLHRRSTRPLQLGSLPRNARIESRFRGRRGRTRRSEPIGRGDRRLAREHGPRHHRGHSNGGSAERRRDGTDI